MRKRGKRSSLGLDQVGARVVDLLEAVLENHEGEDLWEGRGVSSNLSSSAGKKELTSIPATMRPVTSAVMKVCVCTAVDKGVDETREGKARRKAGVGQQSQLSHLV